MPTPARKEADSLRALDRLVDWAEGIIVVRDLLRERVALTNEVAVLRNELAGVRRQVAEAKEQRRVAYAG